MAPSELLSPREVHTNYGLAPQTLANYRWQGIGPRYIKLTPGRGGRIRYRRSDVELWLDGQTIAS
ncbi:helix-turn-helix domain-containing protein [Streptomyces yerevanensis]|uniref:helix-turn-helix domain-containing protein n=1 Tax=Streptomyces yerevanensis TaxID=66378 RepID=UPI0005243DAB|nr:helix-turn-helix domain-containing protein [Streptomyces yerevanensis]